MKRYPFTFFQDKKGIFPIEGSGAAVARAAAREQFERSLRDTHECDAIVVPEPPDHAVAHGHDVVTLAALRYVAFFPERVVPHTAYDFGTAVARQRFATRMERKRAREAADGSFVTAIEPWFEARARPSFRVAGHLRSAVS